MKKLFALLGVFCMLAGCAAETHQETGTIGLNEHKQVTIPRPEGEIDEGWVYFTQEFTFVPEEDGTYRFLVSYKDERANPYDIYMDVSGAYRELENGCEFDAVAGESYVLCFQYPNHDGRYPKFTLYLGTGDTGQIPPHVFLPDTTTILYCAAAVVLVGALAALLIAERKKNIASDLS